MGGLRAENLQSRKNRTGEGWAGKSLSCYKALGVDQPTLRCWEQQWGKVAPGLELSMAVAGSGFAVEEGGAQLHKPSQQQLGVSRAGQRTLHPLWVCTASQSWNHRIVKAGKDL